MGAAAQHFAADPPPLEVHAVTGVVVVVVSATHPTRRHGDSDVMGNIKLDYIIAFNGIYVIGIH